MSWFRYPALFLIVGNAWAADGFMIGAGVEADSADGRAGSVVGGIGLTETTWVSAGLAKSSVALRRGQDLETLYADLEVDHWFKPVGVRLGVAYWGDSDILDSQDWRGSLYWRGTKASIAANYEYRDFDFVIPSFELFPGRTIKFDADGVGMTARVEISEKVSLGLSGMKYDYSVDFRPNDNRDIVDLVSATRLSLINSLVDHRAKLSLGFDHGLRRWEMDLSTREGVVDGSRTKSVTVNFLTPLAGKSDIELSVGYDDSEVYGDVTFFSVFVYFYGGN